MSYQEAIEVLEAEWSPEEGFYWMIRQGQFTQDEFDRALKKVSDIEIEENAVLPRRLVSLLWYIPLFMHWQTERVQENKGDVKAYTIAVATMTSAVEQLLGVP